MIFSHILSGLVLATTSLSVFGRAFARESLFNRLLWGFYFLLTSLVALIGSGRYAGFEWLMPLHYSMVILSDSLGVVCMVAAAYSFLRHYSFTSTAFASIAGTGLVLFVALWQPPLQAFTPVVPALGILLLMLMAVFSLLERRTFGIWVVCAAMFLGLATKATAFERVIHPIDFGQYTTALAVLCFRQAAMNRFP